MTKSIFSIIPLLFCLGFLSGQEGEKDTYVLYKGELLKVAHHCLDSDRGQLTTIDTGYIESIDEKSLFMYERKSRQELNLTTSCLDKIWVWKKKEKASFGFWGGGLAGLAVGAGIGALAEPSGTENCAYYCGGDGLGIIVAGAGGFTLGGLVGIMISSGNERIGWQRIKQKRIRVEPRAQSAALGLKVTLVF